MVRLVAVVLLATASAAAAQMATVPPPPPPNTMSPLPTQPNFGDLPAPAPPPSLQGRDIPLRRGRTVHVPANRPDRNNFSDRIETCIHAGAGAGLGPNANARFSARCAN